MVDERVLPEVDLSEYGFTYEDEVVDDVIAYGINIDLEREFRHFVDSSISVYSNDDGIASMKPYDILHSCDPARLASLRERWLLNISEIGHITRLGEHAYYYEQLHTVLSELSAAR